MMRERGILNLVLLGDGGVGKTALVLQFITRHFSNQYDPTIEDSYCKQMVIDGESHKLEILDTSGLDDYADLEDKWISTSEAFVLVYDISSISSFKRIPRYYNKVQRALKPTRSPNSQIPMILVGNKCDKYSGREVSIKDGELLAQYLGCEFVETSAKNDINVAKAFCDVTKQRQQYTQSYAMDLERGQKGEGIYPQGVRKVIISEQDIESNAHKTWWQGWWLCNCLGWE